MKTSTTTPELFFNPISLDLIQIGEESQLKLKPIQRYVTTDVENSMMSFYIELTDGKNVVIVPCKYYTWVASQHTPYIICNQTKIECGEKKYLNIEIADFIGVNIDIRDVVPNPLEENGNSLPKSYSNLTELQNSGTKIINCYRAGLVYGMCSGYLENKSYVKGLCSFNNIRKEAPITLVHRTLKVNNIDYIVDLEGVT